MLMICEMCGKKNRAIMKIPCGYYIDHFEGKGLMFTMPNDEEAYRNICLKCITGEKEIKTT
jgi:hypothetical protein